MVRRLPLHRLVNALNLQAYVPTPFPTARQVEQMPGGFKVLDASGQGLAYIYARDTRAQADIAKVLTFDEARRIAVNVAKLPKLLGASPD